MNYIEVGDVGVGLASVFNAPSEKMVSVLRSHVADYAGAVQTTQPQAAAAVLERFDFLNSAPTTGYIKALKNKQEHFWSLSPLQYLKTIDEIKDANEITQRYIMANPTIRRLTAQGTLHGYNETYVDLFPKARGPLHIDYRNITNSVAIKQDDGYYYSTTYADSQALMVQFTAVEKLNVLKMWDLILDEISNEISTDPTSPW
jgi:hypothetical protein